MISHLGPREAAPQTVQLRVDGLACGYGNGLVLRGVSFTLERGSFTGVLGPNGSGKTTLLRVLCRVLVPRRGHVLLDGHDLSRFPRRELARRVAMVGPDWRPQFEFTVAEVVALGRIPHLGPWSGESPADRRAVERALELTGTGPLAGRLLGSLSEGERQRVMIARALAQEPSLLLLDEPTSHLDISHQVQVLSLLHGLTRGGVGGGGLTVLAVMHDLNLAAAWCDRLLLLHEGRVFAAGSPEEVLTPEVIRRVYGGEVLVLRNPVCGSPYVVPALAARSREITAASGARSSRVG